MLLTDAPGLDISEKADIAMLPSVVAILLCVTYPSLLNELVVSSYVLYVDGTEEMKPTSF